MPATPTGYTLTGTVSRLGDKFGFIECDIVKAQYGCDVFVPSFSLQGFQAGQTVDFELMLNDSGKPQAGQVRPSATVAAGVAGVQELAAVQQMMTMAGMMPGMMPAMMGVQVPDMASQVAAVPQAAAAEEAAELMEGTVTVVGPKFGFIACPEAKAQHGADVFCPAAALVGLSLAVGDTVKFKLMLNQKGQPQAHQVQRSASSIGMGNGFVNSGGNGFVSPGGKGFVSPGGKGFGGAGGMGKGAPKAEPVGKTYFGTVSAMGAKFGFITCPPVTAQYGTDVFCPATTMSGLSIGSKVDFELNVNAKGQPQAFNVRPSGGGKGGGAAAAVAGSAGAQMDGSNTMFGSITTIGPKFGFISCPPVMAQLGVDVFCPGAALFGYSQGDQVDFELMVNQKGQPQAHNVRPRGMGGQKRKWG